MLNGSLQQQRMTVISVALIVLTLANLLQAEDSKIYMVTVKGHPVVHYTGYIDGFPATATDNKLNALSENVRKYVAHLATKHDMLLNDAFPGQNITKLYSYHHVINGFAVQITPTQATTLMNMEDVMIVEEDERVRTFTTHTPEYLGLPKLCWPQLGGPDKAGEGIVIGIVDTGIDPTHPSFFSNYSSQTSHPRFTGKCEIAQEFPQGSCNSKIVAAQHFAKAAVASGEFNASIHFASPLDADGHGTHTAATAAGNNGVPVMVNGFNFGKSSGMAPRAQISVYKALYRYIGGFFADVVAAIDQATADGVDILSLSVGPSALPRGNSTFLSTFDLALLSAVKGGVFVTQAVGNGGPYPRSSLSFSPWIFSVAAATHDRTYPNSLTLGNNLTISGIGLAPGSGGVYSLVLADDAVLGNISKGSGASQECQNAEDFDASKVQGKILVCTYNLMFLFGVSTLSNAVSTAEKLNATGLVLVTTPDVDGHNFQPIPVGFPAIIIPTLNDSSVLLAYYNTSTVRDESGKLTNSGATASISGGEEAFFSYTAPRVATFSSRGPDVSNNNLDIADVLKPNVMAPGNLIWAAWSPIGTDEREFKGKNFAIISGTSMATPHIAGIAALVKQKFPTFSPAAIASAMATSATTVDSNGNPLLAQHPSSSVTTLLGPASPFDFGAGFVDPASAINPGLIFDAGYEDYLKFLCSIPGVTNSTVFAATGSSCNNSSIRDLPSDLNMPYISIANLLGSRTVVRTVTSVATETKTYFASLINPEGVSISMYPRAFKIRSGESVRLIITLNAIVTANVPTFGKLVLMESEGLKVHVPVSVYFKKAAS